MFIGNRHSDAAFSEFVSVVAFYGSEMNDSAKADAYASVLQWFRSTGREPTHFGAIAPGFPPSAISFAAGKKRIQKNGFVNVRAIELGDIAAGGFFISDFWTKAHINADIHSVIIAADNHVSNLSAILSGAVASGLFSILHPEYAIGYTRARALGPTMYAVGLPHGLGYTGEEYEEARRISRWGDVAIPQRLFRAGLLRDVYPISFLNTAQLSSRVGGVPLAQWILGEPGRGSLSDHESGLRRWDVRQDQIGAIRTALWDAGVLFDWRRHGG